MRASTKAKVCFPVDGTPSINRAIEIYNQCGLRRHIVVVGALAGQVVETVGAAFDNVSFVYQARQLGTANAANTALKSLETLDTDPDILVVAGDRIIDPGVLEKLFHLYYSEKCDLVFLGSPKRRGSLQGRIVEDRQGWPLAIVEVADIRQRQVVRDLLARIQESKLPSRGEIREMVLNAFPSASKTADEKSRLAFPWLWSLLEDSSDRLTKRKLLAQIPTELKEFEFVTREEGMVRLSPEQVNQCAFHNNSIYLVKKSALQYAMARMNRDNVQGEEYLSDMVGALVEARRQGGPRFATRLLKVLQQDALLSFNNPAELLEVETIVKSRKQRLASGPLKASPWYRSVRQWRQAFGELDHPSSPYGRRLSHQLVSYYGKESKMINERIRAYRLALRSASKALGPNTPVFIVRSPGRLNVMGRHIDHQGGNCNLMTIGYETLMIIHAREDDRIRLFNQDPDFEFREIAMSEFIRELPWDDWLSLVNSEQVTRLVRRYGVDWSQYILAAALRLQMKFGATRLKGMDMLISGNIPMAAGLSSSSSLVVGAAQATITINQLDLAPAQVVDLCGQGEWYVGTRGGSADHAAVMLGRKSKVIKVSFYEFEVQEVVPFPEKYVFAVCDSGIRAKKSANARDQFNHHVCCYQIAFRLIRKLFPQYAPLARHLRDINVNKLGIPLSWIYKILLHLPEQATQEEIRQMLPDVDLSPCFKTHKIPADGLYPIRGVALFGLAEIERARLFADMLKGHQLARIGRMMNISHDGDRVARLCSGVMRPYQAETSNSYILSLIEAVESGVPERVMEAQLQWQAGSYACSLPEIDRMVDTALQLDGVIGAQLAGAGLGGCMMILAHRASVSSIIKKMETGAGRKKTSVLICKPVEGSRVLMHPR